MNNFNVYFSKLKDRNDLTEKLIDKMVRYEIETAFNMIILKILWFLHGIFSNINIKFTADWLMIV